MSSAEITFAVVLAIGAAELFDYFCWLSKKLVHRAAYLRYGDSERAEDRAEQWADIIESRPGQILKLATALGFLIAGAYHAGHRRVRAARALSRLRGFVLTPRGAKVLMASLAAIYGGGGTASLVIGVH